LEWRAYGRRDPSRRAQRGAAGDLVAGLVMSMTSYAMTAHLALNLIWLWFFLRTTRLGMRGDRHRFLASACISLFFTRCLRRVLRSYG